jgi:drug/metabolite transporter (DMT)-like permease
MKYFVAILAIAIGVAGVVAGGIDDSPGGRLLGVLLIIGAVVLGVRMVKRNRCSVLRRGCCHGLTRVLRLGS